MRTLLTTCSLLLFVAPLAAQDLRRGLTDADAVVVGRQIGKKPHDENVVLHRVQVITDVRGAAGQPFVTVLDWPKLGVHNRPSPRQSRLYCLQDVSQQAARLGLPTAEGPYFRMVGWAGSNPLIGAEVEQDPLVRLARLLASAESGAAPGDTANALHTMALGEHTVVRLEAARMLTERGDLRGTLHGLHWSQLMARASGELEDVDYKIALAELCAEQRLDGLLDALAVSLGPTKAPEYARCVGRIGAVLHGEQATEKLAERLRNAGQADDRRMLLLAIGATQTQTALDALSRMDKSDQAVEAAMREHRVARAREASGTRK